MADEEKGINFYFNGMLPVEVRKQFEAVIEEEARKYIASDSGKKEIAIFVQKTIRDNIDRHFSYSIQDNPEFKRFQKIVTDATLKALADSVTPKK
jgi:hypothetical protein